MFDHYRYRHNALSPAAKYGDPRDIDLFVYDDGRCRLNRRGPDHRLDSWYATFADVAPVLSAMQKSNRYVLHECVGYNEFATMSDELRRKHAMYLREVPHRNRAKLTYIDWLCGLSKRHEYYEAPAF